jgi:hypothetical protein
MKTRSLFLAFFLLVSLNIVAQEIPFKYEYQQITAIESVVPGGLGRSRLIATDNKGQLEETKLENFFSMVGINFGNIKENDLAITKKLQMLSDEGWELFQVNSGSYSGERATGIFITRYLFRRVKK